MPDNSNPDLRGEGTRIYYQEGEFDTTQADAAILTDAGWIQLCQVDVNETDARELEATEDACSGDDIGYTAGRIDRGITVNMNEFRLTKDNVRKFDTMAASKGIVAVLVCDADRDDSEVRGGVMNCLIGSNNKTSPQKGLRTRAVEFKPAARTAFRYKRVYGANVAP